jgi:hypothetical protein
MANIETIKLGGTVYDIKAATAIKLANARTISLTGSVTGSGSFDGSGNLSIATTTNHNHAASNITSGVLGVANGGTGSSTYGEGTFTKSGSATDVPSGTTTVVYQSSLAAGT